MVANQVPCSIGVVSAVLNSGGSGVIRASDKTRERVVEVARKLGFKSGYSPHRIGIFIHHETSAMPIGYSEILAGLVIQEAVKNGFAIEILSTANIDPRVDSSLDGAIGIGLGDEMKGMGNIPNFPAITINQPMLELGIHSISCNHRQQGNLATEHALKKGHRRIALLEAQPETWGFKERVKGYKSALKKSGIEFDPSLIGHTRDQTLQDVLTPWIDDGITLILNFHAQLAFETLHILGNIMNLRIGEDISTLSIDDLPVFKYLTPPQTVIHQPLDKMAKATVKLLLELIENPDSNSRDKKMKAIEYSCNLIERNSVKDLSGS